MARQGSNSLRSSRRSGYVAAGDIGGTQMRTALVDSDGKLVARASGPTNPETGIDDGTERFSGLLSEAMVAGRATAVLAIGVSSAGPIDPSTGVYYNPPNLQAWNGRSMKPALERRFGVPVVIGHDARVAALAEMRWGAARGLKNVIYVTVSTGIGGGLIVDGRPVHGVQGLAGEVGHIVVDPDGPACNGGCRGCVEVIASGRGVANAARRRIAAGEHTTTLELAGEDASRISGRIVFDAAARGDRVALEIIDDGIRALGIVLGGLLNTFAPEILILGGSVASGGYARYWSKLDAAVRRSALLRYQQEAPIVLSKLGDDVSVLGAAAIAFETVDA
jgi:glucokinase